MMPSARCSPMAVRGMGACRQGVHVCVTIISFDLVPRSLSDRMSLAMQTAAAIACARKKCTAISLGTGKQSASHGHPVCWTLNEQSEQLPRPPRSSEHVLGAARGYHRALPKAALFQQPAQSASGQAIEAPTQTSLGHCRATVARIQTPPHTVQQLPCTHTYIPAVLSMPSMHTPYNTFAPPTCSVLTVWSRRALSRECIVRCRVMVNAFHDMHAG